jgi:hypothetical protein
MVFEDALTILSYASPYDVQLEVENASSSHPNTLIRTKRTSGSNIAPADRICHPFYRSQSIADLTQVSNSSGLTELYYETGTSLVFTVISLSAVFPLNSIHKPEKVRC